MASPYSSNKARLVNSRIVEQRICPWTGSIHYPVGADFGFFPSEEIPKNHAASFALRDDDLQDFGMIADRCTRVHGFGKPFCSQSLREGALTIFVGEVVEVQSLVEGSVKLCQLSFSLRA